MDIRKEFPFLINNPETIYFDAAATSLKPQRVIDRVVHYYTHLSSNVFRADYDASIETSDLFEAVRHKTKEFLNVNTNEIIFTSGASESLNLVALGFASQILKEDDVILVNEAEHASNILPWFKIAEQTNSYVEYIPIHNGHLDLVALEDMMKQGVKIVSIAHVSNVLGIINDIKEIARIVHKYDAYIVVDGAQAIGHFPIDVKDLDVDFYAYSAHKMFGPTGVGVLYGKYENLEKMRPVQYGGGSNARFNNCGEISLKGIPERFESGTPNIEGVLGYGAAIDFVNEVGLEKLHEHEHELVVYLLEKLKKLDNIIIYNEFSEVGLVTFNVKGIFAQDVAAYLNTFKICVRSGSHCSKLMANMTDEENTVRLSLSIYNTKAEIDKFIDVIENITLEKTIDIYL
ncbi:MAG: cysteine desulfurase [Erysipelothrix sp.]|nr:cysteine desulfurase [Erysipelothrix sp.]